MSSHLAFPANYTDTAGSYLPSPGARDQINFVHASPIAGSILHFSQDQEIYGDGDNAEHFYKVVSGTVRSCKFLDDGRRHIESFHVAGDIFGFEDAVRYSVNAEAVNDCTLASYRKTQVVDDNHLRSQVFSSVMRDLARAHHHTMLLGCKSAREKMAGFLIEWAAIEPGCRAVNLVMSRQDIADYLGLTIETVSRMMSLLEHQGYISRSGPRHVELKNRAALRALDA